MWAGRLCHQQPPFPLATALSFGNRRFLWQPPSPYNNPLLFVIPSEAEGSAVLLPLTVRSDLTTMDFVLRSARFSWRGSRS
jgi:hypothetical protein